MPRGEKWLKDDVEGFLFFYVQCIYLSLLFVVRVQICIDLWSCRMSPSWPAMTCMHGFKMKRTCRFPNIFSTDCSWQNTARCFRRDTKGADGAAHLLEALSESPLLEGLGFSDCYYIPAAAWQKVRNAKWLNLKKANFSECLEARNGWRFYIYIYDILVLICLCWKLFEFRSMVRFVKFWYD